MKLLELDMKQAIDWYVNFDYDLQTIADHYKITEDELKYCLRSL